MKEIESGNDFIEYAEGLVEKRVLTVINNLGNYFEKIRCGELWISDDDLTMLVERYNSALRLFTCGENEVYQEFKYEYKDGCLFGPTKKKKDDKGN